MRGTCPECGLHGDITLFLDGPALAKGYAAALDIPSPLASRVVRYLRLFRPAGKALAHRKAARLLEELAAAIRAGEVTRKGQPWAAPLPVWEAALDEMLERPPAKLPITTHGYLLDVVASTAAKGAVSAERQRETQARQGPTSKPTVAIDQELTEMTNDLRALQTLETHNPGQHAAEIERLKVAIAARHTR
mgnify:CR=1 FL=1